VSMENSKKPRWLESFEAAVQDLREQSYDLLKLTKTKRERELTSLLTAHLLATSQKEIVVNEVNHGAFSKTFSPLKDGERADLMIVETENRIVQWEKPKLFAEFKFWYNYDLEPRVGENFGKFQTPRNYLDNLLDLQRLYEFKKSSPDTTCLQGFFFCYNIRAEPPYQDQGTGIAWFHQFLELYCNHELRTSYHQELRVRTDKSTDEKILQRKLLLDDLQSISLSGASNVIPLVTKEETNLEHWLYLALIEIDA